MDTPLKSLACIAFAALLSACSGTKPDEQNTAQNEAKNGNVIRVGELTMPATIFPHKITSAVEGIISSQIYEGLVRINPKDLTVVPGLAESWEVNGKTITFHLRKGIAFHGADSTGKGDEITSKDVKFTFELLCSDSPDNVHYQTVCENRIVGADAFHKASARHEKADLKGFTIIDDHTFSIELLSSPTIFLEVLANPVAGIINQRSYEAQKTGSHIGAGPFVLDERTSTPTHYALYRNKSYYAKDKDGRSLPYIDSLIIDILPSAEEALNRFEHGNLDFISSVPSSQVARIVAENIKSFKNTKEYILEQNAEMICSYYLFNLHQKPFDNVKARQAVNYAIDRNRIIEKVLFGQAYGPAIHGVVPPTFGFYKTNEVKGYTLDIEKAKQLLKEAGYPDGKGFPEVQLVVNAGNSANNSVAAEIQKQLKTNLNINVTFESVENAEKFRMQNEGKGNIFGDGWVADYPNPESFLSVFYGADLSKDMSKVSYPNTARYSNSTFDKYFEAGRNAANRDSAAAWFFKAEQVMIGDAPVIPLWYDSNCRLMKGRVKNFYSNALRYYDFSRVSVENTK